MHIRIITLLFIFFASTICNAQQDGRKFNFEEVGWAITLPKGYEVIDSTTEAASVSKGQKVMEESNNVKIDISQLKTLISASKNQFSYFNSTITHFDATEDGDYEENNQDLKDAMYQTFTDQMPNAKIDSTSSTATIDGLSFDKFQIRIPIGDDIIMTMILLNRLHRNFDFGITYLYLDETTREEIEHMLSSSKFEK